MIKLLRTCTYVSVFFLFLFLNLVPYWQTRNLTSVDIFTKAGWPLFFYSSGNMTYPPPPQVDYFRLGIDLFVFVFSVIIISKIFKLFAQQGAEPDAGMGRKLTP